MPSDVGDVSCSRRSNCVRAVETAALGSCVALALSCRAAALQQPSDLCAGATRALRGTLPFLTPAAAASTAWSLVAEEGGKLHAMDEWIDRLAQAQVATEVERMRRAPKGGERIYSSPSAISNQILSSFFASPVVPPASAAYTGCSREPESGRQGHALV